MGHIINGIIGNRVFKQNKNYMCAIVGDTGGGKTYTALSIAESFDRDFNITRVVFTAQAFIDLVNTGTLRRGSVVVWDEAGAGGIATRDWYKTANKMINYVLQTFRHKNLVVIFTTPSLGFIDSQARVLFHALIIPRTIDYSRQQTIVRYNVVQHNPKLGKTYFKNIRTRINGKKAVVKTMRINKPTETLIKAYEEKKTRFTAELNRETAESIRLGFRKRDGTFKVRVLELSKKKMSKTEIAKEVGCSLAYVGQVQSDYRKNGR